MLVTDDDDLAARARLLRSHGMTTLTWDRHKGHAGGYDVIEPGFNFRIDEPRATLAIARLARLDSDNERRAAAAGLYRERLGARPDLTLVEPPSAGDTSANHLFTAVLPEGADRDAVRERLSAGGVQSSVHYPPVHRFTAYDSDAELPLTDAYAARALTLPLFPHLTEEGIELVVRTLGEALDQG
jgi:dTDP-4-amino-4,6-dideoxygalactose transaminase